MLAPSTLDVATVDRIGMVKAIPLLTRGFNWIQERPFNR